MTNAQAIEHGMEQLEIFGGEHREFIKLAIKALEQQSSISENPNNCDLISRQAVLETLDDMDNVLDEDRTIENYKELLKECYEVLPSVKPQEPKYCDRNICQKNEYNGIGCDECEVTKSQEPKAGHWIKTPKAVMGEGYMWYCDKCGHEVYQDSSKPYPSEKYCPNCGAKMVEPQERSEE